MRIAQVAPLIERVPPKLYGGTERVVAYLTDELVRQGHDVTLFASGDSRTLARLVPCSREALRLDPGVRDPLPHAVLQLEAVRRRADRFDVLHFHTDYVHFPLFRPIAERTVTTLHGRLDLPDLHPLYREFGDVPLVSISASQRRPMPPVRWIGTVHHGLPRDLLRFSPEPEGGYLAFLGRIADGEAARPGDRDRQAHRHPAQDLRQGGPGRRALLQGGDRAAARPPAGRVRRRDRGRGEAGGARRRAGAPVPDRLAGAVRPGHDRGHGLRHARHRLPLRLGAGGRGARAHRLRRRQRRGGASRRCARSTGSTARPIRRRFEERFTAERMARDYVALYERLRAGDVGGRRFAAA